MKFVTDNRVHDSSSSGEDVMNLEAIKKVFWILKTPLKYQLLHLHFLLTHHFLRIHQLINAIVYL